MRESAVSSPARAAQLPRSSRTGVAGVTGSMLVTSREGLLRTAASSEWQRCGTSSGLWKVRLRSGHTIEASPNYRVLTCDGALEWRALSKISVGDYVAVRYGANLWPYRATSFHDFLPPPAHGSQKTIRIPAVMTVQLAFFLGAYAAEGHTTRDNHTVTLTNSDLAVLDRIREAAHKSFGLDGRLLRYLGKCPGVSFSSKTLVEYLSYLGCGTRASEKRIPDAILASERTHVLSFLQGLSLDAYVTSGPQKKWAICVDSPGLLDDLQALLTNLGIVHSRIRKYNSTYDKSYDEVYASGQAARALLDLVPFPEALKQQRASLFGSTFSQSTVDIVPGVSGPQLYARLFNVSLPASDGTRKRFGFLRDSRSMNVSRNTIRRLSAEGMVPVPSWLLSIITRDVHFSPVVSRNASVADMFTLRSREGTPHLVNGVVALTTGDYKHVDHAVDSLSGLNF